MEDAGHPGNVGKEALVCELLGFEHLKIKIITQRFLAFPSAITEGKEG